MRDMHPPDGIGSVYAASGATTSVVEVSEDEKQLRCTGYFLDCITDVGELWMETSSQIEFEVGLYDLTDLHRPEAPGGEDGQVAGLEGRALGFLQVLIQCLVLDRNDRYL